MLEEDYIMRVIHEMVATLLKLVFHIDLGKHDEMNFKNQDMAAAYARLLNLIEEGKINEAENQLLDDLDAQDIEYFKMSLLFYEHLNQKDSRFLEGCDFSKIEIVDGLKYVSTIYGYDAMAEALLGRGSE